MSDTVSKRPFHFIIDLEKKAKSQGLSPASGEDGNDNHDVSHKLCGFQECVGGRIVMMKEQCGACSNFLLRFPGKLHN
jgi:hypothetical protein